MTTDDIHIKPEVFVYRLQDFEKDIQEIENRLNNIKKFRDDLQLFYGGSVIAHKKADELKTLLKTVEL